MKILAPRSLNRRKRRERRIPVVLHVSVLSVASCSKSPKGTADPKKAAETGEAATKQVMSKHYGTCFKRNLPEKTRFLTIAVQRPEDARLQANSCNSEAKILSVTFVSSMRH